MKRFAFVLWNDTRICVASEYDLTSVKMGSWAAIAGVGDKAKPHPDFDNPDNGYWLRVE